MAFLSIWKVLACHLRPAAASAFMGYFVFTNPPELRHGSPILSQILASASVSLMTITMVHKFLVDNKIKDAKIHYLKKNFYDFWIYNPTREELYYKIILFTQKNDLVFGHSTRHFCTYFLILSSQKLRAGNYSHFTNEERVSEKFNDFPR